MTEEGKRFIWRESYSVGVASIDVQHRALLDILNHVNHTAGHMTGGLWKTFEELNEYAAYHFLSEEKLMQEHLSDNDDAARHIAQHRNYWVTISDFKRRHAEGEGEVAAELLSFLNSWWLLHIQGVDKQMGTVLNQVGVN